MMHRLLYLLPVAALAVPASAAAEWRCDCTTILDSCAAEVSLADEFIEVTADTGQCARVDYFVDGMPFVAVVTEGRQRQDWISRSGDPSVLVQSCQVCRDNAGAAENASEQAARDPDAAPETLEPLIEITPAYPEDAANRGASGFVEVEFTVLPSGAVEDISVTQSEPAGLFDEAAVSAVRRWRYPQEPERAAEQVTERLEFSPASTSAQPAPPARENGADEVARGGPVGQCVRQDAVYNYGDTIEVALINACTEPLAVYACAESAAGRWQCIDADEQRQLLVARGDERTGESAGSSIAGGSGNAAYVDALFVTRAPNTQYWWLACRADATGCRGDAREWVRAVDGQSARIDPQRQSPVRVSRSY